MLFGEIFKGMKKYAQIVYVIFIIPFQSILPQLGSKSIPTAFSTLLLVPDAIASGMGDVGVSTDADNATVFWNSAKMVFSEKQRGININYFPYLQQNQVNTGVYSLSAYRVSQEKTSAMGLGLRYFSQGDITEESSIFGQEDRVVRPVEFSFSFHYSKKIANHFSLGMQMAYLNSDLKTGVEFDQSALHSFSGGVSFFYTPRVVYRKRYFTKWRLGLDISNIGPKVSYSQGGELDFLPTNLRIGGSKIFGFDEENVLQVTLELNKLLVPTPPIYEEKDTDGNGIINDRDEKIIAQGKDNNINFLEGVFQSFYDAPSGFSEEISEYAVGIGMEYIHKKKFKIRTGKFYEDPSKGIRNYFTIGLGVSLQSIDIDFSYLFSDVAYSTPLQNTAKFSISYYLKDNTEEINKEVESP